MKRKTRYQGAIIHDHHILLIRNLELATGRTYWLFPGGGLEEGESEEACVVREMREETNITVKVERLVMDQITDSASIYQQRRTYSVRSLQACLLLAMNQRKRSLQNITSSKLAGSICATRRVGTNWCGQMRSPIPNC